MAWAAAITGFTLGAAGSLHCIGMCGPLSLALPVQQFSRGGQLAASFLYQAGRILTYSLLGVLLGSIGERIYFTGYQQWFSILLGAGLLVLAALSFIRQRQLQVPFLQPFYQSVQRLIIRILKSVKGFPGFFLLGMANGLLPCGMVYIALATSLSFTSLAESLGFMAAFGAGTLPAMVLVSFAGFLVRPELRSGFRRMVPVLISLMGVLLILRGLNLGIPFISPAFPAAPGESLNCHP